MKKQQLLLALRELNIPIRQHQRARSDINDLRGDRLQLKTGGLRNEVDEIIEVKNIDVETNKLPSTENASQPPIEFANDNTRNNSTGRLYVKKFESIDTNMLEKSQEN